MRAEFKSDKLNEMPKLIVIADNEIEWRALQLYMHLMDYGSAKLTVAYSPPGEE